MTKIILAAAFAAATLSVPIFASAGNCDHSWQQAKDGSACGGRAADQRKGGKYG